MEEGGIPLDPDVPHKLQELPPPQPRTVPVKPPRIEFTHKHKALFMKLKSMGHKVSWCFVDGADDGDYDQAPSDLHFYTNEEAEAHANLSWFPEMPTLVVRFD